MIKEIIYGDIAAMLRNAEQNKRPAFNTVHGCNCHHAMGSGIAGQFAREFPQIPQADIAQTIKGDSSKLGTFSVAYVGRSTVFNGYTQFDYGTDKPNVDYDAIKTLFTTLNAMRVPNLNIPMIGAGLAGGDWDKIQSIINEATPDIDISVIAFDKDQDPLFNGVSPKCYSLEEVVSFKESVEKCYGSGDTTKSITLPVVGVLRLVATAIAGIEG